VPKRVIVQFGCCCSEGPVTEAIPSTTMSDDMDKLSDHMSDLSLSDGEMDEWERTAAELREFPPSPVSEAVIDAVLREPTPDPAPPVVRAEAAHEQPIEQGPMDLDEPDEFEHIFDVPDGDDWEEEEEDSFSESDWDYAGYGFESLHLP
ncbi:hypothetical protein AAVH_25490, partial [Aphelenchoides avenae]